MRVFTGTRTVVRVRVVARLDDLEDDPRPTLLLLLLLPLVLALADVEEEPDEVRVEVEAGSTADVEGAEAWVGSTVTGPPSTRPPTSSPSAVGEGTVVSVVSPDASASERVANAGFTLEVISPPTSANTPSSHKARQPRRPGAGVGSMLYRGADMRMSPFVLGGSARRHSDLEH